MEKIVLDTLTSDMEEYNNNNNNNNNNMLIVPCSAPLCAGEWWFN